MEYIIGRNENGTMVKVPQHCNSVSGRHVKITVDDHGCWALEDLDSTNGTFVRDDKGGFHRVYTKRISKDTIIRLGGGDSGSFVFTAGHLLAPAHDDYEYEFLQLKRMMGRQLEEERKKEKIMKRNGWIAKFAGFAVIAICFVLDRLKVASVPPDLRYILISSAPVVMGVLFNGNAVSLKAVRRRREKVIVCPRCERPLSEFDVEHRQCSRCKAR